MEGEVKALVSISSFVDIKCYSNPIVGQTLVEVSFNKGVISLSVVVDLVFGDISIEGSFLAKFREHITILD